MESAPASHGAVLNLAPPLDHDPSVRLVEVDGSLKGDAIERWRALLRNVLRDRTRGIAVDLRGCALIDPACLGALGEIANALRARGGGVTLVVFSGSELERQLEPGALGGLPTYDTAKAAVLALVES